MKARDWLDRGNQENDPIDAFTNYWRSFNNLYYAVGNESERDKIKLFLEQNISEDVADELLQTYKNEIPSLFTLFNQGLK